jgi:hypothetical protein
MLFTSYKEAHEALEIPGSYQRGTQGSKDEGIISLKMTNNPSSLDKISDDLSTVFYVGIGKKSSQGEPSEDQTLEDQEPFFTSKAKQNPIPILIKLESGKVYYAGTFRVKTIRKQVSPKGFQYYEIVLFQT